MTYTTELPEKEALYALYDELGWNGFLRLSADKLLDAMKGSLFSVYVYDGDKLVATGRVVSDGVTNAYICGLGVLPDYRRAGIATNLIEKLKRFCIDNNLHAQFFCESELVSMYEKMGFETFAVGMKIKYEN